MSDSDSTRTGYDSTGRYHVPPVSEKAPEDMCGECRAAPGEPHAVGCVVGYKLCPTVPIEVLTLLVTKPKGGYVRAYTGWPSDEGERTMYEKQH